MNNEMSRQRNKEIAVDKEKVVSVGGQILDAIIANSYTTWVDNLASVAPEQISYYTQKKFKQMKKGDCCGFINKNQAHAVGTYVGTTTKTVKEAYKAYKEGNGILAYETLDDFIDDVSKCLEIYVDANTIIQCHLFTDMKYFNRNPLDIPFKTPRFVRYLR